VKSGDRKGCLFILDEVQKATNWSETVKKLWDEDTRNGLSLRVLILGSSPLLMGRGLSESLAGRFEIIRLPHWSFWEMKQAFGLTLQEYLYFGGYPKAVDFIDDPQRWTNYILDAIIETTIGKDILHMKRVDKPALLRQVFQLGCACAGQILSYQKMLGQLQDAGNTTTLAHYLQLLEGSGMLAGLEKFTKAEVVRKRSSPKLIPLNTAPISALSSRSFAEALDDPESWGRLLESAVGSHLINESQGTRVRVSYWRQSPKEVDFVLSRGDQRLLIEVKSGGKGASASGFRAFNNAFGKTRSLVVGRGGISVE